MHQLISISNGQIDGHAVQTVNARELWTFLESKQHFSDWIKGRIDAYGFIEGEDFTVHKFMKGRAAGIDYFLTISMAKELAMVESSDKGRDARRYFIECERRALEAAGAPAFTLPDFANPASAARAWAIQYEAAQTLAIERDHAIKTKAQIGDKKVATAMATASHLKRENNKLKDELGFNTRHATVIAVEGASGKKFGKQDWRPLKAWCKANSASSVTVPCARYGKAQAWPAGAWGAVYGVDLVELFGEVEA